MRTPLCDQLGLTLPLFAFTRSREVVVEVSRAGGMGVFASIGMTTEAFAADLDWIDAHIEGRPYGVDVVIPAGHVGGEQGMGSVADLQAMLPAEHLAFVNHLLERFEVPPLPAGSTIHEAMQGWTDAISRRQVEIALTHPIKLLANALGPPPADVIEACHDHGVLVAALIGSVKHARAQVDAGVDVLVAQGTEAGGHTGDVSTFVLVPEVVDAVAPRPVLAAGGIGTGRQIAASLALGAQGAWTGSIWLTTAESHVIPVLKDKLLAASSRDTVRSRSISGKPARQLKTEWSRLWDSPDTPDPLPMPLQFMLTAEAVARIHHHAAEGGRTELLTSPVGQIVGRMNAVRPAREVIEDLRTELESTLARLAT